MIDEPDIKIPVIAEADTSGFDETQTEAKQTGKEVSAAAESTIEPQKRATEAVHAHTEALEEQRRKAAETPPSPGGDGAESRELADARREAAEATRQQGAAAAEAAQQEAAMRRFMELSMKTAKQLQQEMDRLNAARKGAAAAGDTKAYQTLTTQYGECQKALGELTKQANLQKAATMGQVSAGMQFAGGLKSLGGQIKSGSTDLAGMASQVLSLGFALKSGLGPIGWVMMAIEGLSAALDAFDANPFTNWQKEVKAETEKLEKETRELSEAFEAQATVMEKLGEMHLDASLAGYKKELDDIQKGLSDAEKDRKKAATKAEQDAAAADEKRIRAADELLNKQKHEIELAKTRGEISEQDYRERLDAIENEHAATVNNIREEAALRKNLEAVREKQAAQRAAEDLAREVEEKLKPFENFLHVKMPTKEEWDALQLKIDTNIASAEERARYVEIERYAQELRKEIRAAGYEVGRGTEHVIKWVKGVQDFKTETDKAVKAARETADAKAQAAHESKLAVDGLKEENKNDEENRKRAQALADEEYKAKQAAEKREEEWRKAQSRTLEEQEQWLKNTLGSLQRGSTEWKKWEAEARKVAGKKISEALDKIKKETELTGKYEEEDKRTARQILEADKRRLNARKEELQRLLETPGIDHAQILKINEELKAIHKAEKGLAQSMEKNAKESSKWLKELKPPKLEAKHKHLQKSLDSAGQQYANLAKRAEEAAKKGNTKAMDHYLGGMKRLAGAMDRMAKKGEAGTKLWDKTNDRLKAVRDGAARAGKESEKSGKSAKKQADATKKAADETAKGAKHAKDAADSAKKEATARKKAADNAEKGAKEAESSAKKENVKVKSLTDEISRLKEAVKKMEAENGQLRTGIAQAAEAMKGAATNAERTADAAVALGQVAAQLSAKLDKKLSALEKTIERLSRKL